MKKLLPFFLILCFFLPVTAQQIPAILPLKERAALEDKLLEERLDKLLPVLMRKQGIDMWLIIAREYNEDPVIRTMLPATWLAARRRTIMLLYDQGEGSRATSSSSIRYWQSV